MGSTWLLPFLCGGAGCVVRLGDSRSFSCPTTLRCVRDEGNVARPRRRSDVVNQPTSGASLSSGDKGLRYGWAADRGPAIYSNGLGPAFVRGPLCEALNSVARNNVLGVGRELTSSHDNQRKDRFRRSTAPTRS